MSLFTRRYPCLPPTKVTWPSLCRRLTLWQVDQRFQDAKPSLVAYTHLQSLHLQGDPRIFSSTDFVLPAIIGQLRTLRSLTLLNLPIAFPEWIQHLSALRYLMVRGTNLTSLPPWLPHLRHLRTLRVENCALTSLPETLRHLPQLRQLGLCDTQLTDLRPELFPPHLRRLDFSGTGRYQPQQLEQVRQALPAPKSIRQAPSAALIGFTFISFNCVR